MKYLAVKHWEEHQHYRNRRPPWIKLHQSVLDNHNFLRLTDAQRAQLMLIWLIASRHNNRIPNDSQYISRAIQCERLQLKSLLDSGFLYETDEEPASTTLAENADDASKTLARRKQDASLEVEREKETETTGASVVAGATNVISANGSHPPPPSGPARPSRKPTGARRLVPTEDEAFVFAHYAAVHPKRGPPDDATIRLARQRLGSGYTRDDLCHAIDGNKADQWHAERRKHELSYILRTNESTDHFIALYERENEAGTDHEGNLTPEGRRALAGKS